MLYNQACHKTPQDRPKHAQATSGDEALPSARCGGGGQNCGFHLSYSLNSLKGGCIGDYTGNYHRRY